MDHWERMHCTKDINKDRYRMIQLVHTVKESIHNIQQLPRTRKSEDYNITASELSSTHQLQSMAKCEPIIVP